MNLVSALRFSIAMSLATLAALPLPALAQTADMPAHPPGKLVDLGGYRLHVNATGKGTPVVVLASSSYALLVEAWRRT